MRRLHKEWKRDVSVVMTALLVCGSVGVPAEAKETGGFIRENGLAAVQRLEPEVKTAEVTLSDQDKKQLEKEETVYVIANADGSPQKLIVSDWLKNAMGSEAIEDSTELTNIVNVKGDESFKQKEGSLGVWDAAGNDIYYQGNIEKELPVDMKVTYHLNGKAVSPDELAGQSGKVTIRFDYTNRQKEAVMVGEKEEELYVPFVLLTSMVLDNENFHNIEISNGKIINDGERTIVMGYAMPGLKDNLDIGSEDFDIEELDIPEYVELTADVTDFELATTLTVATNEIFGDMDIDTQEKMDELSEDMDDLEEAMNELMDGTAELYDGVLELKDGTDELYDGMEELDDGAGKLNDGAGELRDGTKELYDGIGTLKNGAGALFVGVKRIADGLEQITANNEKLNGGAKDLYEGLLQMANAQLTVLKAQGMNVTTLSAPDPKNPEEVKKFISDIESNMKVIQPLLGRAGQLNSKSISVDNLENVQIPVAEPKEEAFQKQQGEQDTQVADGVEMPKAEAPEKVSGEETTETEGVSMVEDTEKKQEQPSEGMEEEPSQQQGQAEEENDEKHEVESVQEPVPQAEVQEKNVVITGSAAVNSVDQQTQTLATMAYNTLKLLDGAYQIYAGIGSYTQGVDQVYAGVQELMKNAPTLNSGIDALGNGARKLKDGANELKNGTSELKDGTQELKDGGQELKDGVIELRDGSEELRDGTIEFNDEGIQKLLDMFNGDLQELSDRMDAVKSAANSYQSFSGISDGVQGNVRFIYKTAAIEK